MDKFYSFTFRGLLTEEALDRVGRKSALLSSEHLDKSLIELLPFSQMDEDFLIQSRRMAIIYIAISSFERSIRKFITRKLIEAHGANWWELGVSQKIREFAKTRQEKESKIQWHTPRGSDPINYVDFGHLHSIISQNWVHFDPHLYSQEWTKHLLETLEISRNVVMHSGELGDRDIERVGSLIEDWLQQVGS